MRVLVTYINVFLLFFFQMVTWIPCWMVPLWTAVSHLPYPAVKSRLRKGVLKPHTVPKTQTVPRVQKTYRALKSELQVPKTLVQVRRGQVVAYTVCGGRCLTTLQNCLCKYIYIYSIYIFSDFSFGFI